MVVAGGDVRIAPVTISHGELKVAITTDFRVSQPLPPLVGRRLWRAHRGRPADQHRRRRGRAGDGVAAGGANTVADLVRALGRVKTSPRDTISILQAMKTAGALYAELIIQ